MMRLIKKYPNRRLYDTEKSAYITLAAVHDLIRDGTEFKVVDADSGEDITRSILVQIIIDQENGDSPIFTTDMLTKFIRFYGDATQNVFGEFLETNMQMFSEQQKKFHEQIEGSPVTKLVQDMTERNLEMWQTMSRNFFDLAGGGFKPATPRDKADSGASKKKKK
jgi:polyhydroxyalkanoate synthesis repressor PhaR